MTASRRWFLQHASAWASLGAAGPLAAGLTASSALAADAADDYKALVCVFLHGGNDAFNTVLATDPDSWSAYTATRSPQPETLALLPAGTPPDLTQAPGTPGRLGGVCPIVPVEVHAGRSFALHPLLGDLATLFSAGRLAVVANVGTLVGPLDKAAYLSGSRPQPRKLFSHNDQQSTWLSLAPEGATTGWGGRLVDACANLGGNSTFAAISLAGQSVWVSGPSARPYQMAASGPVRVGLGTGGNAATRLAVFDSEAVGSALERIVSQARNGHALSADLADVQARSLVLERLLRQVMPDASNPLWSGNEWLNVLLPSGVVQPNPLALQLQTAARLMSVHRLLGVKRQVYFLSLGGFDTHNGQGLLHASLMARLNHALAGFDRVLGQMGLQDQVTTFTASDFGRSFTSNGDGTDHGWGAHHLVMGGAVAGGRVVGRFPVLAHKNRTDNGFDDSPDQLANGVLLPQVSVGQLGASLGRWFGVSDADLRTLFPGLEAFGANPWLPLMRG